MSAGIAIHGLEKRFVRHLLDASPLEVLRGIDLEVDPGSCVVLHGPSGSGKSSLLRCAFRTYRPDAGSILLGDRAQAVDMATATDHEVLDARRGLVGLATQFLRVTPRVAAVDLVAQEGIDRREAADRLLRLGLSGALLEAPPATFSGGERQIVNLAVTLARPRAVLLLDEVTASLDAARRRLALEALRERKDAGETLLAIFHDLPDTPGLVDRVVVMRDGRVVTA